VEPGNDDHYAGPQPEQAQPSQIDRLTASTVNSPEGGAQPFAAPVGRPDTGLGRDQSQQVNPMLPMLKPSNAPRQPGEGLFK